MKLRAFPARQRGGSSLSGFSLVEVLISGLLISGILLVAGFATDRCLDMFRQRRAEEEVSTRGNRLLQRLAAEVCFARRGSLEPLDPEGEDEFSFQDSEGVQAGGVVWSPTCTMRWEREVGEIDDGVDNDGDGLIDEGQIAWIERLGDPDERRAVWGHGSPEFWPGETFDGTDENGDGLIDERGLCVSIAGDVLTIRLTMQGLGPDRNLITKTFQTSVLLRN